MQLIFIYNLRILSFHIKKAIVYRIFRLSEFVLSHCFHGINPFSHLCEISTQMALPAGLGAWQDYTAPYPVKAALVVFRISLCQGDLRIVSCIIHICSDRTTGWI
jgi:hypothetical protein